MKIPTAVLAAFLIHSGPILTKGEEGLFVAELVSKAIVAQEGPVVDKDGNLYFCSTTAKDGSQFDRKKRGSIGILRAGSDEPEVWLELPEGARFNGLRLSPRGTLLAADSVAKRIAEVDLETKEVSTYFAFPEDADRPNDLAITSDGTLYVSLPPKAIWRISRDADGKVSGEVVGTNFSNGIEVGPGDRHLFTTTGVFDIGEDGRLSRSSLRIRAPRAGDRFAFMDGMRTDREGRLFLTRAGKPQRIDGKRVRPPAVIHIFAPDGTHERDVELPHGAVFNLAFGGPDGRTVYTMHGEGGLARFRTDVPGRDF